MKLGLHRLDRVVFISILVVACVSIMVVTHMLALRVGWSRLPQAATTTAAATVITANARSANSNGSSGGENTRSGPTAQRAAIDSAAGGVKNVAAWRAYMAERNVSAADGVPVSPRWQTPAPAAAAAAGDNRPPAPFDFEVTVSVSGQLGNQMFEYASLLGIAALNGRRPFYSTRSQLGHSFLVTRLTDRPTKGFVVVFEPDFAGYNPAFARLPRANVTLMQFLQSWKYFDFMRPTIRRELTFKQSVKDSATRLLTKYSTQIGSNRTRVGVHVRRGDFLVAHHIRKGYHTAPASYVRKAMELMRRKHGDVIFIFVTDDVKWCQSEFQTSDVVVAEKAPADVHMALLASCHHVIMTVGTYGWWGAYLAGGDVVYYWDWTHSLHDPPLPAEIRRPQDNFPPSWIPLPA